VLVGGAAIAVGVREIRLSIRNNLRAREVVDDIFSRAPGRGALDVTAQVNTFFGAGALYDAYVAHGSTAFSFRFSDGGGVGVGKAYDVVLPLCKIADDTIEVPGLEADVPENLTFRALFDPVSSCEIQITRVTL
jgi:Phage tail tube protein